MSMIVREGDVDLEVLKERVTPQDAEEATCAVVEAMCKLDGLRRLRQEGEPAHEIMRALSMVHAALTDVFDL